MKQIKNNPNRGCRILKKRIKKSALQRNFKKRLSVEIFNRQFIEVNVFDKVGRVKIDVIVFSEIHNMVADYDRRCGVEFIATFGYVFAEIRISKFFVVRNRGLLYYFVVFYNLKPEFYHCPFASDVADCPFFILMFL